MKDKGYLVLVVAVAAGFFVDATFNGSAATVFLVRKLFALVEYLEFWR